MLKDATSFLKRKVKKIEYENVDLPAGYESAQSEYRKLRDSLDAVASTIRSLSTYEHGGKFMKSLTSFTNLLASKSKLSSLRREDMYTDTATVGEVLAEAVPGSPFRSTAKSFSEAYAKLSDAKQDMNAKLEDASLLLSTLRKSSKSVDSLRSKVADLRYDLEELIQKGDYVENTKNRMQAEYNMLASDTLSKMQDFVGQEGLAGILNKIMEAHREFSAKATDALTKTK